MVSEKLMEKKMNDVSLEVRDCHGRVKQIVETNNLITNAGIDWLAGLIGNAAGAPAKYVAVTEDTDPSDATDTTLAGELATHGLSRAAGTYGHTTGIASLTVAKVFAVTGGPHDIAKAALFNAASMGTMAFEADLPSPATVDDTDSLTISWAITF